MTVAWKKLAYAVDVLPGALSPYAVGDLIYAPTTTTLGKLADVAVGSYLASGGIGVIPAWATLNQAAVAGLTTADGPSFAHLHLADVAAIYTAAESWIGPSSTAGIYFKGGFVGIGTTAPVGNLHVNGQSGFGDSVTTDSLAQAGRAFNLIATNAVVNVSRISTNINTEAPTVELVHYISLANAESGTYDAFWDFFANSTGFNIRDRNGADLVPFTIEHSAPNNFLSIKANGALQIRTAAGNDSAVINLLGSSSAHNFQVGNQIQINDSFTITPSTTNGGSTFTTAAFTILGTGLIQMNMYGAGTATFDASGNISSVSDEKLKTILGKYTGGIAQLMGIEPIVHKWNEKSGMEMDHEYVGFSAQNVQKNMPEAVYENKDGYLSYSDKAVIAALVNTVKQQQTQIEALQRLN